MAWKISLACRSPRHRLAKVRAAAGPQPPRQPTASTAGAGQVVGGGSTTAGCVHREVQYLYADLAGHLLPPDHRGPRAPSALGDHPSGSHGGGQKVR